MNTISRIRKPLFPLGHVVSTPAAIDAMAAEDISGHELIQRHQSGDWGDLGEDDRMENELSLRDGNRLLSSYTLPKTGVKVWVITEADRSATTFLLPMDY